MLFSSITFLFVFLPILLIILILGDKKFHNIILFIASILFYAFGEPRFLPVIFGVILTSYVGAYLIERVVNYKKLFFILTVVGDLAFLFYFKYFNFFAEIFNNLTKMNLAFIEIILPLGISFYTFQALSYVIDVYRGNVKAQKNLFKFSLYICLFPQLIAGPIIKYHDIEDALNYREISFEQVCLGTKRFIIGLAKKMLIANTMGTIASSVFTQDYLSVSHFIVWFGAISYTLQIYFDFSGYSDMAIGLGNIFGFKFMENFNYPYISKSITEFWRRWHISLSTWFKEYLYIPLGGNKNGKLITVRNLFIVFLLTGLWHGASWNFILWGLWNGFFIIIEKLIDVKNIEMKFNTFWYNVLKHTYCMFIVILGWVLFYNTDLDKAVGFIKNMLFMIPSNQITEFYSIHYYADTKELLIFTAAILCSMPLFKNIFDIKNTAGKTLVNIWLLMIFLLSVCEIAAGTYNPFIYFRF